MTNTKTSSTTSYVDIFDTADHRGRLADPGGAPVSRRQHEPQFKGKGFEALVQQTGSIIADRVYREVQNYEGGNPRFKIYTDKIDVSCIAADPNAPPIPFAIMTNLSASAPPVGRGDGINYHGDKWSIQDASVSYAPITERDWDFHNIGPFVAEKITNPGVDTYNPAYWPCDLLSGGDLDRHGLLPEPRDDRHELPARVADEEHQLDAGQPPDLHLPAMPSCSRRSRSSATTATCCRS